MKTSSALLLPALLAAASTVFGADPPGMMHIAMSGRDSYGYPDRMTMSWETNSSTATSNCKYATNPALSNAQVVAGVQSSYLKTWQHHATTLPLNSSTVYFYSCGDNAAGWSPVSNFTTSAGVRVDNFTILQVADMGVYNSYNSRQLIGQLAPTVDWLLWSGDICYADDAFLHDPFEFAYELTWDVCQTWLSNTTSFTPFMVGPGNHEAECHSPACLLNDTLKYALHNFTAYTHRFAMPSNYSVPNAGTLNQWYSFNYGPVHFVVYDGETSYPNSPNDNYTGLPNGDFGDQVDWLQQDLEYANTPSQRSLRPWIIVTAHRPLYTLASCESDGTPKGYAAAGVQAFEDMFYKNQVDVHFSGHVHAYERQAPVYRNVLTPNATTYIVSGAGGNTEGHSGLPSRPGATWNVVNNDQDYGIGRMSIDRTSFKWEFLRSADGAVLDTVTLHK